MARYMGTLQGARGPASRLGGKDSGLKVIAASWQGGVKVELFPKGGTMGDKNPPDEDWCRISFIRWHGGGTDECLYVGPVSGIRRVGLTEAGKKAHHATHARGKR